MSPAMHLFALAIVLFFTTSALAQPAAHPDDVSSVDALMEAVYDVISGPAGQVRDWDRFRTLFIAEARLIVTGPRPDGTMGMRVMTPEDYITRSGPVLEREGFFEEEIARKVERYGSVVHVFSTYAAKRQANDVEPFMRGINSFQLWYDGTRWWVVTIYWQAETPGHPIPETYLPTGS